MGALSRFSTISDKGDNFCDFLFAFLYTHPLLKRGLLLKERICSPWEQIFPFSVDPFSEGSKLILSELSPLKVYPFPLSFNV